MIDDSAGLVTPHGAFRRIVEITHPQKPNLGDEVTSAYWFREIASDHPDSIACSKALKFLATKVEDGKIRAQGIRPSSGGPIEINLGELRIGELRIWEGKLVCRNHDGGARLYRDVFLSMADLNRELGATPAKEDPKPTIAKTGAKLATGADFKFDWDGALIEVMAFLQQNPPPTRPGPIVKVMQEWFKDQPSGEPQREPLYQRARRILERMKSVE
jgi:hypothetical protein